MIRFVTAVLSLASIVGLPVIAGDMPQEAPGKHDRSRVKAGVYTVDGNHTQILFSYKHLGLTDNMGLLSGGTGRLTLDPKRLERAELSIEVPVNTLRTSIAKYDADFQSQKFFNTAEFPVAKFKSSGVVVRGDAAEVVGDLTIKGITKKTTFSAKFAAAGLSPNSKRDNVAFEAKALIKRSDFGLGGGVPLVGDEVTIEITSTFERTE